MLTILLIRHASCDHVGRRIAGRAPGVHLNARGRLEAEALAGALSASATDEPQGWGKPVALYSGPLERARETAAILGARLGLPVQVRSGLDELDFGSWTGRLLEELSAEPQWVAFNAARGSTRIPDGEHMAEAVDRALAELVAMEDRHPGGTVAVVTHGDVIRGLLLRCLGMTLDEVHRLEVVAPASVSVIRLFDGEPRQVIATNWSPGRTGG
jgi:broad specificity phosphatase PhoE